MAFGGVGIPIEVSNGSAGGIPIKTAHLQMLISIDNNSVDSIQLTGPKWLVQTYTVI